MVTVRAWKNRSTGELTNRITVRVEFRMDLMRMVDGLASHFAADASDGDELPAELSKSRILDAIRLTYEEGGTALAWTWRESTGLDEEAVEAWARGLIVGAWPEMAENQRG